MKGMFIKEGEKEFSLKVLGYEFKSSALKEDLNWLSIEVQAASGFHMWKASGPYLQTIELQKIALWLKDKRNGHGSDEIDFLEPELRFMIENNSLLIFMNYDLHPKGNDYNYGIEKEFKMSFSLTEHLFNNLISSLNQLIIEYPIRK